MVHSCLAVEYNKKAVDIFGLIYQRVWTRDNISHRKTETRGQRAARDNEGKLWENSLIDVSKMLSSNPKLINIGDRGSDIFTYLSYCKINHWNYVIRAKHNRSIVQNGKESKLFNCLGLSECKTKKMTTIGNELIELNIAWEQISLMVPRYIKKGSQSHDLNIWAIRCWNDERQIEWILLTNLQINNANDALEKIDWYSARWLIEEYHKCLKTGCAIEKRNLQTANGLKNILGFLGIIATQILKIKFLAKINRNELAITWMDKLSLRIICSKFRLQDASITMMKFWHSVARMGGFIGRKSDGDPGWQTLWKGWMCLSDMARTFEGLQKCG